LADYFGMTGGAIPHQSRFYLALAFAVVWGVGFGVWASCQRANRRVTSYRAIVVAGDRQP